MAQTSIRYGLPRQTFSTPDSGRSSQQSSTRSSRPFLVGRFRLRPDERWAIIGKSGSGKSIFARWIDYQYFLAHWPIVIVDPKKRYVDAALGDSYSTDPAKSTVSSPYRITDGHFNPDARVQIYLPTFPAINDPVLNKLFFQLLERGGVVLHIEDMSQVANESKSPMGLTALMTDGRAAEVVMLMCAQRPVGIPRNMIDQAENFVFFRMPDIDDRTRASKILGDKRVERTILPKRYFWYLHEGDDFPTKFAPLPYAQVQALGGIRQEDRHARPSSDSGESRDVGAGGGGESRRLAHS